MLAAMNSTERAQSVNLLTAELLNFINGCEKISRDHQLAHFPNVAAMTSICMQATAGDRFIRIARAEYQRPIEAHSKPTCRSAHCFIDRTNGDVLKAAGWSKPAKGARGNIFNADNGLTRMGEY